MFGIEVGSNISFGIGLNIYFHRHYRYDPIHFHLMIEFISWFIELRIGKDYIQEEDNDK